MPDPVTDFLKGTLDLMVLKTLETMGPLHGYGVARRIEQTSGDVLQVEEGSLYPALHKLEDRGLIVAEWGITEHNRRAKFYRLTAAGRATSASWWSRASIPVRGTFRSWTRGGRRPSGCAATRYCSVRPTCLRARSRPS